MTNRIRAGAPMSELDAPPAVSGYENTAQLNVSNTTFAAGSPDLSVTFTAPTSGRVLVIVGGGLRDNGGTNRIFLAPEIREDDSSGAIVQSPDISVNSWSNAPVNTSNYQYGSRAIIAPFNTTSFDTALEPGRTYFARVTQAVDGGTTADIFNREITIVPVPMTHSYFYTDNLARASDRPQIVTAQDRTTQLNVNATDDPGDPEVSLTFIAPNSGRVLIVTGGGIRDNTGSNRLRLAPEIRIDRRGGPLLDHTSTDNIYSLWSWSNSSSTTSNYQYGNRMSFIGEPITEGLEPGRRYFVRLLMDGGGGTCDVFNRDVFVFPLS